jgi:hypothetical protein
MRLNNFFKALFGKKDKSPDIVDVSEKTEQALEVILSKEEEAQVKEEIPAVEELPIEPPATKSVSRKKTVKEENIVLKREKRKSKSLVIKQLKK